MTLLRRVPDQLPLVNRDDVGAWNAITKLWLPCQQVSVLLRTSWCFSAGRWFQRFWPGMPDVLPLSGRPEHDFGGRWTRLRGSANVDSVTPFVKMMTADYGDVY